MNWLLLSILKLQGSKCKVVGLHSECEIYQCAQTLILTNTGMGVSEVITLVAGTIHGGGVDEAESSTKTRLLSTVI